MPQHFTRRQRRHTLDDERQLRGLALRFLGARERENPAILAYVAQTHPAAHLAPVEDAYEFGRIQAFNNYLCATVHVAHAHRMRAYRWADDPGAIAEMKRKVPQNVGECFALIENEMFEGPWVMGERFTICDPYLFTLASWIEGDGVDPARYPKVVAHRARMAARPNVAAAIAEEFALKAEKSA